jgi:hypothetical protein
MTNHNIPSFDHPQESGHESVTTLVEMLNDKTGIMSSVDDMIALPAFQEMMTMGEGAFTHILADKENFSHWHSVMAQLIAQEIDEPIEFPDEVRQYVEPVFALVIEWLENREQTTLLENQ